MNDSHETLATTDSLCSSSEGFPKHDKDTTTVKVHEIHSNADIPALIPELRGHTTHKHVNAILQVHPARFTKAKEYGRLSLVRMRMLLHDMQQERSRRPVLLSSSAKHAHNYVEPLGFWWGKNTRLLLGQSLPTVEVQDRNGAISTVINGTSHNYAGFYETVPQSEELQRLCLQKLPLADARAVPLLETATHEALAHFLGADFCYTTSTGFGSNYVAFPALLSRPNTVVLADQNCHNSMFSGMYLAVSESEQISLRKFAHNGVADLEEQLQQVHGKFEHVIVAVEGLYSMEADVPPLADLQRLKKTYNFTLLCDEAHSLLSIGKTGRGCVEHWNDNHPDAPVSPDLIDIRTATLSKAIGGIGGVIAGKACFQSLIRTRITQLLEEGGETLGSSTMVQTMWVLGQPTLIARRLSRLADMSRFCRSELARFGIHVFGDVGMPMIPVYTGRGTYAARLSYLVRGYGLLASPVAAPAVPKWEARIRINLSAEHTDDHVNRLVDAVIRGARDLGLCGAGDVQRLQYKSGGQSSAESLQERGEASSTYLKIRDTIDRSTEALKNDVSRSSYAFNSGTVTPMVELGCESQQKYGLGSGGSRWTSGAFPPQTRVESVVSKMMGTEDCLTYPDGHIGLASTIAALCRPVDGFHRHYLLLPHDRPLSVSDGLKLAPPNHRPKVDYFHDTDELCSQLDHLSATGAKTNVTVYLRVPTLLDITAVRDALDRLSETKRRKSHLTLLVHTSRLTPPKTDDMVRLSGRPGTELLISGSFHEAMGLPGAFLAGSAGLIKELRFTSRGYMFTTSPQPFVMDVIGATLEKMMADVDLAAKKSKLTD